MRLPALLLLAGALGAAPQTVVPSLTLFAGTADGLWRSVDWGQSWARVEGRRPGASLEALGAARAIWPLGPQVWLGGEAGVFLSDDWGDSWTQLAPSAAGVTALLPSRWPHSDPTVFVGTEAGLLRSLDGARTLAATPLDCAAPRRLDWPGPALAVACDRGVFLSSDSGARFTGPGEGWPAGPAVAMALSSYFAADPVLFAAPRAGGVYRSSDGGASWRAAGLSDQPVLDLLWIGRFLYAAGERALYRSEDAGVSWTRLSSVPGRPSRLIFPLGGLEGFLATDRGIFRTPDVGEHWEPAGARRGPAAMRFCKAHGLGNDFILVALAAAPADPSAWARRLCDRHRGIGGDGVVLHAPEPDGVRFGLINADGLPGEISGNGLRCLAALAVREGWASASHLVRTVVGERPVQVTAVGGGRYRVATDLGVPALGSREVPVAVEPPRERVIDLPLEAAGRRLLVTATSMGNPHCAVFCDQPADDALLSSLGPALERHPLFPRRTNVEFVTVVGRGEIRVRCWERGVGYTQASGTGSASAVVAAVITGRCDRTVRAVCDGGVLEVEWPQGGSLRQTGEVQLLFDGDWTAGD